MELYLCPQTPFESGPENFPADYSWVSLPAWHDGRASLILALFATEVGQIYSSSVFHGQARQFHICIFLK